MCSPQRLARAALLSGLLATVLASSSPHAAPSREQDRFKRALAAAERLYGSLEYEKCLAQLALARAQPHGPDDEVRLLLYEGVIYAELGNQVSSDAAFGVALQIQPDAKLPDFVSPKIQRLFEAVRARRSAPPPAAPVKEKAAAAPLADEDPALTEKRSAPFILERRHALVPAIAGGALVVAGGVSWLISRRELARLDTNDPSLQTPEDVRRSASNGRTLQTIGGVLLGVGSAGLATAAGVYLFGRRAPESESESDVEALSVSTDGTSAFVMGRW